MLVAGSSDANKAIHLALVHPGAKAPHPIARFHPQFTYPIFGDGQTIFGYQQLRINLRFASHDLRPNLQVAWDRQYKTVGDTKAADITHTLKDWLPSSTWQDVVWTDKTHGTD